MYDLNDGTEKRITDERVYSAAWSPTSLDVAIVTLDAADRYGFSVIDGQSGHVRKAAGGLLDPDYIEWSPDGKRVFFSKLTPVTENYFHDGEFERNLYEYDLGLETVAEVEKGVLVRHGGDGERRSIEVEAGASARLKGLPVNAAMSGGALYVESSAGRGVVKRWDEEKGEYEIAGEGRIYAAVADAVVIRDLTPGGVVFRFATRQSRGDLYTFTSSWKLPFEGMADLNQGGALFSGGACDGRACNILSHRGLLGYALDWQQRAGQSMGPSRILAPEEGTVAAVVTNITCNSFNPTCQIGWDNYTVPCVNAGGAGNYVSLAHPDGSFTFYGHMRSGTSPLTVGQFVGQGAYLGDQGHSGSTGQDFGNYQGCGDHIHFQRQVSAAVWAQSIPTDFIELPCLLSCRTNYTSQNSDTSAPAAVAALTVTLTPQKIAPGGTSPANRVILPVAAVAPGTTVTLSSASPDVTVPPSVTVPAGAAHALFPITVSATAAPGGVIITAQEGSQIATAVLNVKPVGIYSLNLSSAPVVGGNTTLNNEVVLTDIIATPATIGLTTSNAAATPPASLAIPAGGTYATFSVGTTPVVSPVNAVITATYAGSTKSATQSVTPLMLSYVTASTASVLGGLSTAGTVVMNGRDPVNPAQVTLTSSDPSASVPASVTVNAGSMQTAFTITTSAVLTPTPVTITAAYNGVTRTVNLTINPVQLLSITLGASSVVGGATVYGTRVNLNAPAGPGNITVQLTSSNPAAAPVPATIAVPAGATQSPGFPIITTAVSATTVVTITATYNVISRTANLTVNPVVPSSISLSLSTVAGGAIVSGNRVNLNAAAGSGGALIALTSSDPALASVAATVTAAAGITQSAAFPITTSAVSTATVVTITATYNGVSRTTNLTLTPTALSSLTLGGGAVVGGTALNGSYITLTGPSGAGGATVTLTSSDPAVAAVPANVAVAAGASQSGTFAITTTAVSAPTPVTIMATLNGVNKTAVLTVNPVALTSVSLGVSAVVGGATISGTRVNLNAPAGPGSLVVSLSTSDPSMATVAPTVTIPAGATQSPVFTIATYHVPSTTTVNLIATYNGVARTAVITLNPPVLASLTLSPASVIGGGSTTSNRVNLTGPAGPGGDVVQLASSDPAVAAVPATVTVAAGSAASPFFPIATTGVTSTTPVTITATHNGVVRTAILNVNP